MTLNIRGYDVTVIANIPSDPTKDSFTATKMFLRDLAMVFREAGEENMRNGYKSTAQDYRFTSYKIHHALDKLEEGYPRRYALGKVGDEDDNFSDDSGGAWDYADAACEEERLARHRCL